MFCIVVFFIFRYKKSPENESGLSFVVLDFDFYKQTQKK